LALKIIGRKDWAASRYVVFRPRHY
jgi:hypothetical protein